MSHLTAPSGLTDHRLFKTLEELNNNREVLKNASSPGGVAATQAGYLRYYHRY